jgi:hypothetical protein
MLSQWPLMLIVPPPSLEMNLILFPHNKINQTLKGLLTKGVETI